MERLPKKPRVIEPAESIGKYGGTWYRAFTGPADGQNMERPLKDHMIYFDTGMKKPQPNIAESWTVNDDATEFTFTLSIFVVQRFIRNMDFQKLPFK